MIRQDAFSPLWGLILTVVAVVAVIVSPAHAHPVNIPGMALVGEVVRDGSLRTISADVETEFWKQAREADSAEAYGGYLKVFPDGRFADQARQRIEAISGGGLAGQVRAIASPEQANRYHLAGETAKIENRVEEALENYGKAADLGHPDAAMHAGRMLWRKEQYAAAFRWLERAVEEHDNARAHYILGISYEFGHGKNRDLDSALSHYKKGYERAIQQVNALKIRLLRKQ